MSGGWLRILLLVLLVAFAGRAWAETRLALIITNAAYPNQVGALLHPHRDGALIAAALEAVGFEKRDIAILRDVDQPAMRTAVAEFIERIEKAGPDSVAFLYYSGHGAADRTERGENYLIPVAANITIAKQLPILGVSLTEVTKSLERVPAKARFLVVDACRNVAFSKGLKDVGKGLVPERKLEGMIVAFATRPGETAEDNNIYASALAGILPTPGMEAEQVFKETQRKVAELSKGTQIPWTEDGLLTRFKFREAAPIAPPAPPPPPLRQATQEWSLVDKESVAELETFVRRNATSPEADYARARLEEIKKRQTAAKPPPQIMGWSAQLSMASEENGKRTAVASKHLPVEEERQANLKIESAPVVGPELIIKDANAFYNQLMEKVLGSTVNHGSMFHKGRVNRYRDIENPKSLAVCIDWTASTQTDPVYHGWWFVGGGDVATKPLSEDDAARQVHAMCVKAKKTGCSCTTVDINDRNVLKFPTAAHRASP